MLDYAEALAQTPPRVSRQDVDALRELGWSDAAILDMAQVTAYFSYVNRIASGLGVELEAHHFTPEQLQEFATDTTESADD
jgi:alkylhydroperoxidase family enzyme